VNAQAVLLRGRRRAAPIALGLGVLAVAVIAVLTLGSGGESPRRSTTDGGSTATVTRQTLVERETVTGTLGYAGSRTVINRLGSGGSGGGSPTGTDPSAAEASGGETPVTAVPAVAFTPDDEDPPAEEEAPNQNPPADEPPSSDDPSADGEDPPPGDQPDGGQGNGGQGNGGQQDDDQGNGGQGDDGQGDDGQAEGGQPEDGHAGDGSGTPEGSRSGSPPSGSDPDSGSGGGYSGSGTVTALPKAGSVIERGGALYRLDGDPVVLMYGSTPAYRALQSGVGDGRDVRQLERNLAALGFDPGTVDETFTSSTAAAVSDWQESLSLPQTGSVELGRVVFQPGPRRVGEHKTSVGSVLSAGSEVLETSSTTRVVTVELDATLQSLAKEGEAVEVTMPDGSIARGRIADVGRVAREVESSGTEDPNAEQQLVIDVTVHLRSKKGIGRLDEAPVGVGLAQESRKNVLAVPVNALVARRGGGYGVELAGDRRIVPVETGLFADGYVEVSGAAIREGTRVVVPSE
jgi:hypothetical protein